MEVMRDRNDNCVIICSIENFDPMGVHTGDSITVAPIQTLTDKEFQIMRDGLVRGHRAVGVETGGSNIQFAVNPDNGRMVIIEMNPRVSRSSALASKLRDFRSPKLRRNSPLAICSTRSRMTSLGKRLPVSNRRLITSSPRYPDSHLKNFPECRPDAQYADEKRRRGHGHSVVPLRSRSRKPCARWKLDGTGLAAMETVAFR